jgi:transcriptional regulator with XRE-family HTH domain
VKIIVSVEERVEKLKLATGRSLEEIRKSLGLSRAMFHYIRRGERNPSWKIMQRLEAAERAAGIGGAEHPPNPRAGPATLPPNSFRLQESAPDDDPFAGLPPDIRAAAQAIAQAIRQDIAAELSALETRLRASLESKLDRILKSQAKP